MWKIGIFFIVWVNWKISSIGLKSPAKNPRICSNDPGDPWELCIKGTHIHLIEFITVYLTDFCILVYVSSNSGKTIDECNAMIQSMNSKIANDTWGEEDLGESNIFLADMLRFTRCWEQILMIIPIGNY